MVVEMISLESVLDGLLEEYFYGLSLRDDFEETMRNFNIPTDKVAYARKSVLKSLSDQVSLAFDGIWPSHQYSYQFLAGGDLVITEMPSVPTFGRLQPTTWDAHDNNRNCDQGNLGAL